MLTDDEKKFFAPLREELYQTLLGAWCYKVKIDNLGERLATESRAFLLEEMTALNIIATDTVLRICKFDDDSSNFSLLELRKHLFKTGRYNESWKNSLIDRMKRFRAEINVLKVSHRNAYIAHLNESHTLDPFKQISIEELISPIKSAVVITEMMWGSALSFGFALGSQDPTINFRQELDI